MIESTFNVVMKVPFEAWAILIALMLSMVGTQFLKYMLPYEWEAPTRQRLSRLIALLLAVIAMALLWPTRVGLIVGIIVGMLSMWLYYVGVRYVEHSARFGWLRSKLSQDVREKEPPK